MPLTELAVGIVRRVPTDPAKPSLELTEFLGTVTGETVPEAKVARFVEDAAKSSGNPGERDTLLQSLKSGLADPFQHAVVNTMKSGGRAGSFNWIPLSRIAPPGRAGFIIPELQESYRAWVGRRRAVWDTLPAPKPDLDKYLSREAFVENVSKGRARVILDALLGPNPGTRVNYNDRQVRAMKRWRSVNHARIPAAPGPKFRAEIVTLVRDRKALAAKIKEALIKEHGTATDADVDKHLEFAQNYLLRHASPGGDWVPLSSMGSRLDEFSENHVKRILGQDGKLHPDELVHRLIEAHDAVEVSVEILGTPGVRSLWGLRGVEGAIDGAIRRSGYEKGFVFELEIAVHLQEKGEDVILQVLIDGKSGPDFVVLRGGKAGIGQAKSFETHAALVGFGGEFFGQFSSDLRRMWREHLKHTAATGTDLWAKGDGPKLAVDGAQDFRPVDDIYTFYVDEARLHSRIVAAAGDDLDGAIAKIAQSDAEMRAWLTEMNDFMSGKVTDTAAARKSVLDRSRQTIGESDRTIADVLEQAIDGAGRTVDVRRLFAMRVAIDPKTGVIDGDLVEQILAMRTPFHLDVELRQPEILVL